MLPSSSPLRRLAKAAPSSWTTTTATTTTTTATSTRSAMRIPSSSSCRHYHRWDKAALLFPPRPGFASFGTRPAAAAACFAASSAGTNRPSSVGPPRASRWLSGEASAPSKTATAGAALPPPPQLPPVLPSPSSFAATTRSNANNTNKTSALARWWDRHSIRGQQRRGRLAETYFQAATRRARDPLWYGPGRVGREFRPRHALLTMHIWFLHKRLIHDAVDPDTALLVQEELFNILWDDTTSRIRQTGTSELLVNKHLMQVQQYTFLHLTHYDHAYTDFYLQRPLERMKELRNLVSHHIFRDPTAPPVASASSPDDETTGTTTSHEDGGTGESSSTSSSSVSADLLDRFAWYIEANYQNVMMDWPDACYREGRVAWVNVPDFTSLRDARGDVLPDRPVHPDDVLPEPWQTNITRRGVEYYWNPRTRESSWERPR